MVQTVYYSKLKYKKRGKYNLCLKAFSNSNEIRKIANSLIFLLLNSLPIYGFWIFNIFKHSDSLSSTKSSLGIIRPMIE